MNSRWSQAKPGEASPREDTARPYHHVSRNGNLWCFIHYRQNLKCSYQSRESGLNCSPKLSSLYCLYGRVRLLEMSYVTQYSHIKFSDLWLKATPLQEWLSGCLKQPYLFASSFTIWAPWKHWTESSEASCWVHISSKLWFGAENWRGSQETEGELSSCTWLTNNESFMQKQLYIQGKILSLKWQKWKKTYWLVLSPSNRTISPLLSAHILDGSASVLSWLWGCLLS